MWRETTRFSGGWHTDTSVKFGSDPSVVWGVQRADERRGALYRQSAYDARAADRAFDQVMADELVKLNVRNGPARIVKVRGAQGKDFPNARNGNAPQWVLRVAKRFKAA